MVETEAFPHSSARPLPLIIPDWPAPPNVKAISTTRGGGVSQGNYAELNLGAHVGDDPAAVAENRSRLMKQTLLSPDRICWLNQVHGTEVIEAQKSGVPISEVPVSDVPIQADGVFSREEGVACAVMTADCLPVLLCDQAGEQVMAVHGGWRGLAKGILQQAVSRFPDPSEILVWLGPAIGPGQFQVGKDVYDAFVALDRRNLNCFALDERLKSDDGLHRTDIRWLADIYQLSRNQLIDLGVDRIYGGDYCTFSDSQRFFSFRRDGHISGRMATLIWKQAD